MHDLPRVDIFRAQRVDLRTEAVRTSITTALLYMQCTPQVWKLLFLLHLYD